MQATESYNVVFHPMSIGVSGHPRSVDGGGNIGPLAEMTVSYPTLGAAILGKDALPPRSGYIAVKIVDNTGKVHRERTAGHHVAVAGSPW